jgi:hypothetical protein
MNWRSVVPSQKTENDVCLPTWISLRCRFLSYALLPSGQKASRADCNSRSSNSVNGRRTPFSRATTLVLSADIGNSIDERFCCQDRTLLGGSSRKKLLGIAMSKLVPANYLVECAQNENRSFENQSVGPRSFSRYWRLPSAAKRRASRRNRKSSRVPSLLPLLRLILHPYRRMQSPLKSGVNNKTDVSGRSTVGFAKVRPWNCMSESGQSELARLPFDELERVDLGKMNLQLIANEENQDRTQGGKNEPGGMISFIFRA